MEKFTAKNKLSKKAKKTLDNQSRGSWLGVKPVAKIFKSEKDYNRQKEKLQLRQYNTEE